MNRNSIFVGILVLLVPAFVGCDSKSGSKNAARSNSESIEVPASDGTKVADLIETEDLVLDLGFQLRSLSKSFKQSPLDSGAFADVTIQNPLLETDLPKLGKASASSLPGSFNHFAWPVGDSSAKTKRGTNPLQPILKHLTSVTSLKFGVLSAKFEDSGKNHFSMRTKLTGKGQIDTGAIGIKGIQTLRWKRQAGSWAFVGWETHSVDVTRAERFMYEDVTESAIPDEEDRMDALRSFHEEFIDNVVQTGAMPDFGRYTSFIDAASPHALPSVSVVDIDSDGWDDLFITARWGKTQLLRNNGDGTFSNIAKEVGLEFPNLVNCSVFVDVDNDGDKDAILGRSLEPVVYLRNDDGKFVNITDSHSNLDKQYMVSAISVSDINRDGLVDIYCSTYGPFGQNEPGRFNESQDWRKQFLTQTERLLLESKHKEGHGFVDNAGPPNFIAMNRGGGKLEVVRGNELISQWHHSYQSAWADADGDGDDDLYISNDFARDAVLINQTPIGAERPVFEDGLEKLFPDGGVGFGMGASWGDFDQDGDLDLYVSNMYSKAGSRIIQQLGVGDPRMEIATRGNFLYENQNGTFKQVSGDTEGKQDVGKVGWSYGGQFIDIDNNGLLDLYVPSGYFSASKKADSNIDI